MAAVLRAVEQELRDMDSAPGSIGVELALSLARTIDKEANVPATRELRAILAELRAKAPAKIASKSDELRKRRDARRT
jgi:hypothetical protein